MLNNMRTKICTQCGEEKPETEEFFYFRKDNNKFRNECEECILKQRKDNYLKNK